MEGNFPQELSQSDYKNSHHFKETNNDLCLMNLHELFIKFKLHGSKLSLATIRTYKINFDLLLQFNPDTRLENLTEEFIINFFEYLNTRKRKVGTEQIIRSYKNSSIATVRSSLNCFFEWLIERNYLTTNPFKKIPYPSVSYTDSRAFTPKEFEKISFAINTKIEWTNLLVKKRNIALVMMLVLTGVRKEELIGLRLSDIDMDRILINVRAETSKSKRTRIIPMSPKLISYIEDYLNYRINYTCKAFWVSGILDRSFTEHGMKHLINLLSKATKINCHLHRFRHTFATNYYKQTHDIVGLQKLMGHKSFKMTLSYLRSLPDEHTVEQIQRITFDEFV